MFIIFIQQLYSYISYANIALGKSYLSNSSNIQTSV